MRSSTASASGASVQTRHAGAAGSGARLSGRTRLPGFHARHHATVREHPAHLRSRFLRHLKTNFTSQSDKNNALSDKATRRCGYCTRCVQKQKNVTLASTADTRKSGEGWTYRYIFGARSQRSNGLYADLYVSIPVCWYILEALFLLSICVGHIRSPWKRLRVTVFRRYSF